MSRSAKVCLGSTVLILLFLKLFLDLYNGASNSLSPNIANDAINLIDPFYEFAAAAVRSGSLPLWNPYSAIGTPFAGDIITGIFYPVNWLIFVMPVPLALLIIQFLTVLIGMAGMYFYVRYLGLALPAQVQSVALFAYALFTESFHPALGSTFCWFPALLWLTHRFFDAPSLNNASLVSVVLALCFLGGFPNFFVYTCLLLLVYFLVFIGFCWKEYGSGGVVRRLAILGVALLLALGLVAVQLLPTYELSTLSVRNIEAGSAYRGDSFWENISIVLMLRNFFLTDLVNLYGNSALTITSGLYYLGGALLLLMPFPFVARQNRKTSIALAVSLVFITLFIFSNQHPALSFLQRIPGASALRVNGRAVAYIQFLLIVLAGIGLSNICNQVKKAAESLEQYSSVITGCLFAAYAVLLAFFAFAIPDNGGFYGVFILCVALIVLALRFESESSGLGRIGWSIALVILLDVSVHRENRFLVPAFAGEESGFVVEHIRQVRDRADFYRVLFVPGDLAQAYEWANLGPKYQISNISAYGSLALARWERYLRFMVGETEFDAMISRSILQRFYGDFTPGLMQLLSKNPRILEQASLRYMITERGNSESDLALPRAYAVSRYIQTKDEGESLAAVKENLPELGQIVVLENAAPSFAPMTGRNGQTQVDIRGLGLNWVDLSVKVEEPSIVVLNDAFYPGWTAEVDGSETTIFRANSLFRAVEVPRGNHTISFRYRPLSLYWGVAISLLSAAVLVVLSLGGRRYRGDTRVRPD